MEDTRPITVAGEGLNDLVNTLRQMQVTGVSGQTVRLTFNVHDPDFANWTRAAERYAADLLTPECDLTREERLELAAQRVFDEVGIELRRPDR